MPFKINVKSVIIYALYAAACVFANCAVQGVPLSLGLMFAMLVCGTNIFATPVLFVLASVVNVNWVLSLLSLFEGVFLTVIVFLYRRTGKKIKFESLAYLIIALAPYIAFAPWTSTQQFYIENEYALKAVAAVITVIFSYFSFKSVYSLLFRLNRCRLKEDELLCLAVTFTVCGAGMFWLLGESFYLCFTLFTVIYTVRLTRSPAALIFALVAALPAALIKFSLEYVTVCVAISTLALLFSGTGRFAAGIVATPLFVVYAYFTGCFSCPVPFIVLWAILLAAAFVIPSAPKSAYYEKLRRRLLVEELLPQTAMDRNRRKTGEKLYRISEVFREIECAFMALEEEINDGSAREKMQKELLEKCCKTCERARRCELSNVNSGIKKLIDAGCLKGRVNLIDLPSEITANCSHPADLLNCLNGILSDYRKYISEIENARSGRKLLAEQAKGVSEVMKGCAVDLCRTRTELNGAAENVKKALAANGVSCPEVYTDGDDDNEVSAVILGKVNIKGCAKIISDTLGRRYVLKDKIAVGGDKNCLVFGAPPRLDAAFGVAYAIKSGGKVSGDTHSVIRINNRTFLMALSDGMGSGEYARKVSESAISLIEAFYRAEMPQDNVLNTINKLLSFNRDERFTCIDIAAVNLETGRADFVKIGSPAGVILREGEIKVLESSSLPLGILDKLRPAASSEILKAGDIVVFMSDGITSAFPSMTDLYEFLQGLKPLNPQNLADKILAGALANGGNVAADDMTVLCTRIFEN